MRGMSHCNTPKHKHAMMIAKYRPSGMMHPFNGLVSEILGHDIGQVLGHDSAERQLPAVNIIEQADAYLLQLVATGFSKGDLKLKIESETLTISGEREKFELKENERFTRREFNAGSFARSFRLPESVSVDGISAELLNGILQVRIPKSDAASPKGREISIG